MEFKPMDEGFNEEFIAMTISNLTGIGKEKLLEHIKKHGVSEFFNNLDTMNLTDDEMKKITDLKKDVIF